MTAKLRILQRLLESLLLINIQQQYTTILTLHKTYKKETYK